MSITVRLLTTDDMAAYRAIRLKSLRDHPEAYASTYESASGKPDDYWTQTLEKLSLFGAVNKAGQLVGLAGFMAELGDKDRHRGWLIQMYVDPALRGTGCAMALVETILDYARGRVLQLHLGVWDQNPAAIRFYEKAGFHIYASDPRAYYWGGRFYGDHLMVRYLDEAPGKNQND
ncbi:GNAT family N-acetyltransferase [Devosia sp. FKR38]|uniref:GNAT family N-acetyltransferase n=1 Tax=Devosia sp. FKR38 TaxID=2562312 RepID=UPI0010C1101F|nr:GNAT family N-acetyltransferase [Devosia sp. FKR38]